MISTWPDGTHKSLNNGFTGHLDGQPSRFALDRAFFPSKTTGRSASHTSTESREKVEATGRNIGTIVGLSKKSAETQRNAKRFHVTVTQGG